MENINWDKLHKVPLGYQTWHISSASHEMDDTRFDDLMEDLLRFVCLIPDDCTPIEKAMLLYTVLCRCLSYDHWVPRNKKTGRATQWQSYTYAGAALNGIAVCNGISQLYAKLCQAAGLRCDIVEGYGNDPKEQKLHAWVLLWLPDEEGRLIPAHCDPTWDLVEFRQGLGFRYFLKSDRYMRDHGHTWDPDRGRAEGMPKFTPCPRDWEDLPRLPEAAVELMCGYFKKMKQPEPFILFSKEDSQ